MKLLKCEAGGISLPRENSVNPKILSTHVGTQVFPLWIFGVSRRFHRIRSNMAECTRHSDAIRFNQLLGVVIGRVGVITLGVPNVGRRLVKCGIRKETQTDNSGRKAVIGARVRNAGGSA